MSLPRTAAFTWIETIIAILILSILVLLALPVFTSHHGHGNGMTQALSNMKQLHLATQSAALDGITTTNAALGWPGDTGGSFSNWTHQLVPDHLNTNDLCKLLSAPGKIVPPGKIPTANDTAVLLYAVKETSPSPTVFLTSANFTNTPTGGSPLHAKAKPYGDKGFVVFRKGGDGAILLPRQVGQTNIIGSFVPLCH